MRGKIVIVAIVIVSVIAFAAVSGAFQDTIPDLNARERNGVPAIGYAEINASISVSGSSTCAAGSTSCTSVVYIIHGTGNVTFHEVLMTVGENTAPASIAKTLPLTFGDDCHARMRVTFDTPDETGTGNSSDIAFHLDDNLNFRFGHLNMFRIGAVRLTFDLYIKGCDALSISDGVTAPVYADWTKIVSTPQIVYSFDGVDGA